MTTLANRLILTLTITLLASCGYDGVDHAKPTVSTLTQNGTAIIGRWTFSDFPLQMNVSTDFTTEEFEQFQDMATLWNESNEIESLDFIELSHNGMTNQSQSLAGFQDDGEMGIYLRNNWFESSSTSLAITQFKGVLTSSGIRKLTHTDIIVNNDFYQFGDAESENNIFDLQTVVLHEMGHVLGLDHINSTGIMQPAISLGVMKRKIYDNDKIALFDLYELGQPNLEIIVSSLVASTSSAPSTHSEFNMIHTPGVGVEFVGSVELTAEDHCIHRINGRIVHKHVAKRQ